MKKLRIIYPVIVEGKYDKIRLTSVFEAHVVTTDGFGVFNKKEKMALIRALADLDSASRKAVNESLDDYYLVPHITRIISVSEKYGTLRWNVETDRGIKGFDIRNRNHDIKVFKDGKVRVRDSDDNRYIIDDYRQLDAHSRAQLIADL